VDQLFAIGAQFDRLLQVDPVEGGSSNDYDYVAGDPVNVFDFDGMRCWTGVASRSTTTRWDAKKKRYSTTTTEHCRSASRGAGRVTRAAGGFAADHVTRSFTNAGKPPVVQAYLRSRQAMLGYAKAGLSRLLPPVIIFPTQLLPSEGGCRRCV
jgi:hypothetical protein